LCLGNEFSFPVLSRRVPKKIFPGRVSPERVRKRVFRVAYGRQCPENIFLELVPVANVPTLRGQNMKLRIHPLTPSRWADFQKLFGRNGACAGCWCMWWRLPRAQWRAQKGAGNREAIHKLVRARQSPGLLAYAGGQAVGWCAVAPREHYLRLAASRVLKPVDDQSVWSVTCFFVAREFRRRGVTVALLKAAAGFVRERDGRIIEGYPTEPGRDQPDTFVFTGLAAAFRKAGFREVARRSPSRPIFRRKLRVQRGTTKAVAKLNIRRGATEPLTRPAATLSPADGGEGRGEGSAKIFLLKSPKHHQ
jgi:GNAT superfamily N-acetyltransferase